MSGRGVITSRTERVAEVDDRLDQPPVLALDEALLLAGLEVGVRDLAGLRRPRGGCSVSTAPVWRSRRSVAMRPTSARVIGRMQPREQLERRQQRISTRSGSRRTISSGSRCSNTMQKPAIDSTGRPGPSRRRRRCSVAQMMAVRRRSAPAAGAPARTAARVVQVRPEAGGAAVAFDREPQRQPHQRAEGRLDRADVDRGQRQEQQHGRSSGCSPRAPRVRSGRRRSPPFRRAAAPRARPSSPPSVSWS